MSIFKDFERGFDKNYKNVNELLFISNTVLTFPPTTKEAQNHKREANF